MFWLSSYGVLVSLDEDESSLLMYSISGRPLDYYRAIITFTILLRTANKPQRARFDTHNFTARDGQRTNHIANPSSAQQRFS